MDDSYSSKYCYISCSIGYRNRCTGVRIIQAIGAALLLVNSRAIITDAFPPEERRLAMSIHVTVIYLAIATGPALGAVITEYIGWRNVFFLNVPLGLVLLPIVSSKLKESAKSLNKSMDWLGSFFFASSLSCLLVAITFGPKESWTSIDLYIEEIFLPMFGNIHFWSRMSSRVGGLTRGGKRDS